MLKLELDWAGDERPDETPFYGEPVRVEYDDAPSPSGWPVVRVYVWREHLDEPEHVAYMRLDGWLRDVYGAGDDEANELANLAEVV